MDEGKGAMIGPKEFSLLAIDETRQISVQESLQGSIVSQRETYEKLRKFFSNYKAVSVQLQMANLHASARLKLKKYKEAAFYGQFVDGKRYGQGIMIYSQRHVYEGEWRENVRHGKGYESFANGCSYEGDFEGGDKHGIGRYEWPSGQLYEGEWDRNLRHGSGMWRGEKGDIYVGEWKKGSADGYGVYTQSNKDRYEGEFINFEKCGEGIEKFANGDLYRGRFEKGLFEGFGEFYWSNGGYYKGHFKKGLRDGQGVWKKGINSIEKYEGGYKANKKQGSGTFTWEEGHIYKGAYVEDMRDGYGEMYWKNGSVYKGQWVRGVESGEAMFSHGNRPLQRGIFKNGELVQVVQDASTTDREFSSLGPLSERQKISRFRFSDLDKYDQLEARKVRLGRRKGVAGQAQLQELTFTVPATRQGIRRSIEVQTERKAGVSSGERQKVMHSSFNIHRLHGERGRSKQGGEVS